MAKKKTSASKKSSKASRNAKRQMPQKVKAAGAQSKRESKSQGEINHLVEAVAKLALRKNVTLAFAESCTGGGLSFALARYAGISKVFLGSVVAYHNDVKEAALNVPNQLLQAHGAVSREVAMAMATGVQTLMESIYAVSVTGIAGPSGGSPDKPVGTVMFGVVGPGVAETYRCQFDGDRKEIQAQSIQRALEILLTAIGK